ncbi:dehydrogenase [Bordetella genomosp. 10]|uniref:Dehydrogenase n=1 Tax=Bordetella genomosp. 10 TaxID=1416804 RepID=A0A261SLF9_9BORD|nr:PQQ-dependent sugar dehydrogenase [Bordetella genomosp. 10]OZI38274.1 dehydrogenase [Bordetella genomosp. 10]
MSIPIRRRSRAASWRKHLRALALVAATAVLSIQASHAAAPRNEGERPYDRETPFAVQPVATFDMPWALAFLPDGRMLVTEKTGHLYVVTAQGAKQRIAGVPAVTYSGQNGLLDVVLSPTWQDDKTIYLSYVEAGPGANLALARARLDLDGAALRDLRVIWRATPDGDKRGGGAGGQPGGIITFSPDGRYLFLTSGDRMRPRTAQDPDLPLGKVLRMFPDGRVPPDNPWAKEGGARALTWSLGHRNPYGLAYAPDGRLWLHEMGPMGGDELNLEEAGKNYGWPVVSYGDNYNGTPIPRPPTHPEFQEPVLYWTPVIAPAGMIFYKGAMFPQWRGSAFIGGLRAQALVRVAFDGHGGAREENRWNMGARIRAVAEGPDGALWLLEDSSEGRLLRLTPRRE